MKILKVIKLLLFIAAIVFIFFDWKISLSLFLASTIVHAIPLGSNTLASVITGYLIVGGIVCLFFDWRFAVWFILGSFLVAMFRIYANRLHYKKLQKDEDLRDK